MKYKCIKSYWQYDVQIMDIGDIVVLDKDRLYNINRKVEYTLYNKDEVRDCLEIISDEVYQSSKIQHKDDSKLFEEITKTMTNIFKKKNNDYGNSFEESLNEEGLTASRIRIGDKWNRFKTLSKGKKIEVKDESIRDTLVDMANYCIMTVMWLDKQNGNI